MNESSEKLKPDSSIAMSYPKVNQETVTPAESGAEGSSMVCAHLVVSTINLDNIDQVFNDLMRNLYER